MPERWTIGKYILVVVVFLVAFDFVFAALKWFASMLQSALSSVASETGGYAGPFSVLVDFLNSAWGWLVFIFTNAISLAVIIVLSLIYEAMESEWR